MVRTMSHSTPMEVTGQFEESVLALHLISEAGSLVFSVLLTPGCLTCKLHGLHSYVLL